MLSISCMAQQGFLRVERDPRIDSLVMKQRQIYANDSTIDGFRVQIFMETGNDAVRHADSIREVFSQKYPETPIYLIFGQPYYRLRIGDFRTRLEAENQYQRIKKEYTNSFVTADRINLPYNPLDDIAAFNEITGNDAAGKKFFIEDEELMFDTIMLDSIYRSMDSIFYDEYKY